MLAADDGLEVDDFTINTNAVLISGGALKIASWVCEPTLVGGDMYIHLDKASRMLARAMGLDLKERWPWKNHDVIAWLQEKRDAEVDKQVIQHLKEDDPLADHASPQKHEQPTLQSRRAGELRQQVLAQNDLPETLVLNMPAFTTTGDDRVDKFDLTVLKPNRKGGKLFMFLDAAHLKWLMQACSSSELLAANDDDDDDDNFCSIDEPNVKWRKRNGCSQLCCRYKTVDGKAKEYYINPFSKYTVSVDVQMENVKAAAASVQKFYDEHNGTCA
jgi:hypothetical protein